jgi:hypothetical protein
MGRAQDTKASIVLDSDSRARVDLHSLLALHTESPVAALPEGQTQLQNFVDQLRSKAAASSEILVFDRRGNLFELSH